MSKIKRLEKVRNLEKAEEILAVLVAYDFEVKQFSKFHFRINHRLDIWPSSKKAYDIVLHRKFVYSDLEEFIKEVLR